jgi:DNA-binding transcriptional LysR family regulator
MSSNITRLRYFLAVAEELNFTRAAEKLFIAQSALSRQIKLLEQDLGTPLFVRTTHVVVLTAAGARLQSRGPQVIREIEELWAEVRAVGLATASTVTFGYTTSSGFETAPRVVEEVQARLPDLQINTRLMDGGSLVEAVATGSLDLGLIRHPGEHPGVKGHRVRVEREGILVHVDDLLAEFESLSLSQVQDRKVLLHPRASNQPHYDHVVELCRAAGFEPQILHRPVAFDPANLPVVDGRAIAVVGESAAANLPPLLRWIPLTDDNAEFDVLLLVNSDRRKPEISAVVKAARTFAETVGWI